MHKKVIINYKVKNLLKKLFKKPEKWREQTGLLFLSASDICKGLSILSPHVNYNDSTIRSISKVLKDNGYEQTSRRDDLNKPRMVFILEPLEPLQ